MRVFVTGASGFIGSAVVAELLGAGHRVLALARSDSAAKAVAAAGAELQRGDLDDLLSLRAGASAAEGVIHLAFNHDFSQSREAAGRTDARAIEAMGDVLAGSQRPLLIASGLLGIAAGRVVTEADAVAAGSPRGPSEELVFAFAARGVRSAIVRLPPTVHGPGDHGFMPILIGVAREKRVAAYVGDGTNRWPAVHRLDAARLFRLALERAPAGTRLHAVAEQGVATREIADVIGRRLDLPTVAKSREEAGSHFGFLGTWFGLDAPASSEATRKLLDWQPVEPGLLADLDSDHYFAVATR